MEVKKLRIAFEKQYVHPLPKNHRFPMIKYELLPQQLLLEGIVDESSFFTPTIITPEIATQIHSVAYFEDFIHLRIGEKEQRRTGFKHNEKLVLREQILLEGTRKCTEYALRNGISMNIAGGTHHAYTSHGEGFCMLNDQSVAAKWLLTQNKAQKILIIDLDVHQGNGTAKIFQNTPEVFTFSMHGKNNYPLHKEKSNLDIELEDGTQDSVYIYSLEKSLDAILTQFDPDFIFYQAGVDILASDKLGRLSVTIQGCCHRDEIVIQTAKQNNIPIVICMGGGYAKEIKHIINAHANTYRTAQHIYF